MPTQQMLLGLGAVAEKSYIDDCFSTYLYNGTGSSNHSILNGIDLAGEGGLVWTKSRDGSFYGHNIFDTERGVGKQLKTNTTSGESLESNTLTTFLNNGFKLNSDNNVNESGDDFASWTFRKASGFFDCIKFTGTGGSSSSPQSISHSLGSIPGMIIIKNLTQASQWFVYHKSTGVDKFLQLNKSDAAVGYNGGFSNITSSSFNVFDSNSTNTNEFIAYVFAGGDSTAATARSVAFDGNSDYLVIYNQADLSPEDGDFTCEMWIKPNSWSTGDSLVYASSSGFSITRDGSNNALKVGMAGSTTHLTSTSLPLAGQWTHVAVARSGTTMRLFFNGVLNKSETVSHNYASPVTMYIVGGGGEFNGKISNFRFVKGTAVYTSSFRPPTEPLANITNTKLLCCNGSSADSSTVTPGTINAEYDAAASTDSPFDDPAAHIFGESGSESVIKCGSYTKTDTGSSNTLHIELGWEPQIILQKRTDGSDDWYLMDVMREMGTDLTEILRPNSSGSEVDYGGTIVVPTATGFTVKDNNSDSYIYLAIRRSDGYVGKPPELGTDVFAMDTGSGSSTIPTFDSGFPVDFAFQKLYGGSEDWYTSARLMQGKYFFTNTIDAQSSSGNMVFDSNAGWALDSGSTYQSWMWKRGAGMDVVCYEGNGVQGRDISHSLGVAPDMMWVKNRTRTTGGGAYWNVYVSGITHLSVYGSDPDNHGNRPASLRLNDTNTAQFSGSGNWDHTHPTSTHFTVGDTYTTNQNGESMIAILFSSISGISKVGYYDGSDSSQTITTGFQPRFWIVKSTSDAYPWLVLDTIRGWGSGNDKYLELNDVDSESPHDFGAPTSTGFTMTSSSHYNKSGKKYIYYAHA